MIIIIFRFFEFLDGYYFTIDFILGFEDLAIGSREFIKTKMLTLLQSMSISQIFDFFSSLDPNIYLGKVGTLVLTLFTESAD